MSPLFGAATTNGPSTTYGASLLEVAFMKFIKYSFETSTYIYSCVMIYFRVSLSADKQSQNTSANQWHANVVISRDIWRHMTRCDFTMTADDRSWFRSCREGHYDVILYISVSRRNQRRVVIWAMVKCVSQTERMW